MDSSIFSKSPASRRTLAVLHCSSFLVHKLHIEHRHLKYALSKTSFVCRASSLGHRRNNPDFSRNNKHGLQGRNRQNEDKYGLDGGDLEDSEMMLSSKNGLDSLLKLLRKSGEQTRKKESSFNSEKQLQGDDAVERKDHSPNHYESRNKNHNATSFTKPASSFRRNSPVPRHKPQASYPSEANFDQTSSYSVTWTQKKNQVKSPNEPEYEPEAEHEPEPGLAILESEPELQPESFYQEKDENDEMDLDKLSDDEDLSALKLIELRAIAKSRGLKEISKMKKAELMNLLDKGSNKYENEH